MAKSFQHSLLETGSLIFSGNRPLIVAIRWLAFHYQLFAAGAPWKWISHIFLPDAADNDFLNLKDVVPLN